MKHKYLILVTIGFVLWLAETAYFGWNEEPVNQIERVLDILSTFLILWGLVGDIVSGLTYNKNTVIKAPLCAHCEKPVSKVISNL